jgi:hypothetical protein
VRRRRAATRAWRGRSSSRHQPSAIAAEIARLGLDPTKLWVGIGSGQLRASLDIVRQAVAELRELLPAGTRIVLAAMRPRLCRVGGAIADGVLLNWMLPAQAAIGASMGARRCGRGGPFSSASGFIRPYRRGPLLTAAAPRRGEPLPQHQRGAPQALRGHGYSAWHRRRAGIDAITNPRRDWHCTTLRSTFRSPGCSRNRMPHRYEPRHSQRRRESQPNRLTLARRTKRHHLWSRDDLPLQPWSDQMTHSSSP